MEEKVSAGRMPEGEELTKALAEAYKRYQRNIRAADEDVYRLTLGARQGVPEKELLALALATLEKCE